MNRNAKKPLINGFILAAVGIYVAIYISIQNMWNFGSGFAIALIAALSAFQFVLYFKVFRHSSEMQIKNAIKAAKSAKKSKKPIDKGKSL